MLKLVCDVEGCEEETPLDIDNGMGLLPEGWFEITWVEPASDVERAGKRRSPIFARLGGGSGVVQRRMRCCNKHLGTMPKPKSQVLDASSPLGMQFPG